MSAVCSQYIQLSACASLFDFVYDCICCAQNPELSMFLIIDLKRVGPERTPEIDYDHGVAPETLDGLTEEASTLPRDDGDEIEDQVEDDAFTSAGGGKVCG